LQSQLHEQTFLGAELSLLTLQNNEEQETECEEQVSLGESPCELLIAEPDLIECLIRSEKEMLKREAEDQDPLEQFLCERYLEELAYNKVGPYFAIVEMD